MTSWDCDPYQEGGIYEELMSSPLQNEPGAQDRLQSAALEKVTGWFGVREGRGSGQNGIGCDGV